MIVMFFSAACTQKQSQNRDGDCSRMKIIIDEAMVCGNAAQRLFPKHPSSTLHVRP
jgi:hypothetical protein